MWSNFPEFNVPTFQNKEILSHSRQINTIDAVLISHSDPLHLGALPYAVGKLGLNCPIYATLPVYKMGQMFMYDLYQSHKNVSEFDLFTLDDVDMAFDRIIQLKYNQSIDMKGKNQETNFREHCWSGGSDPLSKLKIVGSNPVPHQWI